MTSLSFGALRKAQRTLDRMDDESDSADESDESPSTDHESNSESLKESNKASATHARKNKHACVSRYPSSQCCLNRRHQADRGYL